MAVHPVSSPEVDLIFLAEDPLVFASQVGHAEKFLQHRQQEKVIFTVYNTSRNPVAPLFWTTCSDRQQVLLCADSSTWMLIVLVLAQTECNPVVTRMQKRSWGHLGADDVLVRVDVVQRVVVILLYGAEWLLPAPSDTVQCLLWPRKKEEDSAVRYWWWRGKIMHRSAGERKTHRLHAPLQINHSARQNTPQFPSDTNRKHQIHFDFWFWIVTL